MPATDRRFLLRGLIAWLALPVLAIANGAFREGILVPLLGEGAARVLTVATFLCLAWPYTCGVLRWAPCPSSTGALWLLGALWMVLAVLFEFVVFGLALGVPVRDLLHAYDLRAGELWPLVLLGILVGPRLMTGLCTPRTEDPTPS